MNPSRVTNPAAKTFLIKFFTDRAINKEFYERIPEKKFDYRMVSTKKRKSDSPRESLGHQIGVQKDYLDAITTEKLVFISGNDKKLKSLSKQELLKLLRQEDERLATLLSDETSCAKLITVPWSKQSIPTINMLWGLDTHEILHTGWNLAIMDHLNIDRFTSLKTMWG